MDGELLNKVMHPVRPILNDNETISKIDELLKRLFRHERNNEIELQLQVKKDKSVSV